MHVDCVTTRGNIGTCSGSWLSLERLCRRITAMGHRIEVLAASDAVPPGPDAAGRSRAACANLAADLERRWRAAPPDAVHIELPSDAGVVARDTARRLGLPVSASFHHLHLYAPAHQRAGMQAKLARFHASCDATVATCAASRDLLLSLGGPRAEVIHDGVDIDMFAPQHRSAELRRAWGANGAEAVVLWAGRMEEAKGLDALHQTMRILQEAGRQPLLVLAGDGSMGAGLRQALPQARHLGMVAPSAMPAVLASADILLFTSPDEPWGNIVLEAAASGLAVVARSGGAAREVLLPAGGCCDPLPQDAPACAAAVQHLTADAAARARMGAAARAACATASIAAAAQRWLQLWQRLSRRGRPS